MSVEAAIAMTGFILVVPGIIFACLAADPSPRQKRYSRVATSILVVVCVLWTVSVWTAALR